MISPTLRVERSLLRSGAARIACIDEVGRGALAGPVSVGVTILDLSVGSAPRGLRDSKLLTPHAREALLPRLRRWPLAYAVGHAEAVEVDEMGIIAALRLAAARALASLPLGADLALLDGNHDWLTPPDQSVALFPDPRAQMVARLVDLSVIPARVATRIRADLTCAGVAAASVLAKCERDAIMVQRARQHPEYGWVQNKGYSAPEHADALRRLGPSPQHRRTWHLPGNPEDCADESQAVPGMSGQGGGHAGQCELSTAEG
ncbi:MAG: ribonuclease HII [Candidatus Nanopelagicales bacterium]